MDGGAGEGEEGVGGETRAGAVGLPLVAEEAWIGVDVGVLRWVLRAGSGGAVLNEGTGVVLGPETVEGEGEALGTFRRIGVGVAELGGPGEIEEVVVEGLVACWGRDGGARLREGGDGFGPGR